MMPPSIDSASKIGSDEKNDLTRLVRSLKRLNIDSAKDIAIDQVITNKKSGHNSAITRAVAVMMV
jgi:hypothetical protein